MAPVPVAGFVDDGLVAPVLVMVPNAIGKADGSVLDCEVDGGVSVRDCVGPVKSGEEVLVGTNSAVQVAWVVSGCGLVRSNWQSNY